MIKHAALLLLSSVVFGIPAAGSDGAPEKAAQPLEYVRIYHDSAGESHFASENLSLSLVTFSPDLPPVSAAASLPGSRLTVVSAPAGGVADWHTVPRRQINIMLSGTVEIEVSDGEVRRFGPGSYILGEDTEGSGHRTTVVGNIDAYFAVFAIDDESGQEP